MVYLFNAWVKDDASLPTDVISTTATVSAAGDIQPTNDSATDNTQAVLLRDGFEVGGDGAEDVDAISSPDQVNPLTADNLQMLDLGTAWNADGRITELARVRGRHRQGDPHPDPAHERAAARSLARIKCGQ
ncbi:MAG: hypothetical protein IPP82_00960 [Xanthomonadales bacterium]|nr:hypothetical protein [Xanthomonadales bacterium]